MDVGGGAEGEGEAWLDEAEVMSEVHVGIEVGTRSTVSIFEISLSTDRGAAVEEDVEILQERASRENGDDVGIVRTDEHGDLVLPRRAKRHKAEGSCAGLDGARLTFSVVKDDATNLERWITAVGFHSAHDSVLERFQQCDSFRAGRRHRTRWSGDGSSCAACILNGDKIGPYQWTPEDIKDAGMASVFLAADVVYSENLTTAFFETLTQLMPPNSDKVLYLALEKRYNFSMEDLDVVAHGYKHFRSFFTTDCPQDIEPGHAACEGRVGNKKIDTKSLSSRFTGKKIDVNGIPKYIRNYERGDDLELWEIRRGHGESDK